MNEDKDKLNLSDLDKINVSHELKHKTINRCLYNRKIKKPILTKAAIAFALVFVFIFSTTSILANKSKTLESSSDYSMERLKSKEQLISMLNEIYKDRKYAGEDLNFGVQMKSESSNRSGHSNTNVQVEGIDEADIIKTDGKYIYSINQFKNEIIVIKADKKAEVINRFNPKDFIEGKEASEYQKDYQREIYVREMFLYEKRSKKYLVVMSSVNRYKNTNNSQGNPELQPFTRDSKVSIMPIRFGIYSTLVSIIDITNPQYFKPIKQFEVSGNLMSSRVKNNMFYMVTNKWTDFYFYRQEKSDDILPFYIEYGDNIVKKKISPENIMYNKNNIDSNFTIISEINLDELDIFNEAILGNFDNMYMSKDSLYLTSMRGEEIKKGTDNQSDASVSYYKNKTIIYKFELKNKVNYVSFAEADGLIINQFSMDEYKGYFRIATTEDIYSENKVNTTNSLYVFDKNMKLAGSLKDIAPSERIYSTRFDKDKLYMVTFKQVDPLFVIDLKNPKEPKILGLLKIPGYSTYLHPIDSKNILGFGMDTGNIDERVINKGMKIALFDISDLSSPKEKANIEIGGKGTFSESLYNHKALTVYDNLYAFDLFETKDDDSYMPSFRGLVLLEIKDDSIKVKCRISHSDLTNQEDYYTDYGYRAVFIDNYMYVLSNVGISVVNLDDMNIVQKEKI
ncbi:Secreted protein containing C-terminal beta-propeller domain [Caloramator quimbayensis]|uniref:Secreted protein containing C-terminal beta-propeller domain n=1 Tax=Caloramator quimbayensis TaxID=1147123 RepID=A0A1T4WE28_9CLOT|nr:beta-propeller domain-containing protein [Caloramator quimbayensis]SKA75553.1 Secreted protein containing C-terminal beta-propeller domain [Caloramator quimbayensis]